MLSQHKAKLIVLFGGLLIVGLLIYAFAQGAPHPFPVAEGDRIESWETAAPYKDGGELEERAEGEIARLQDLKKSDEYSTYDIYVGIAQWKELLGDGKGAYDYLGKAIRENPKRSLGYGNLAHLMKRMGAFGTAKAAFLKAIEVEPQLIQNYYAYLEFLTRDAPGVSVEDGDRAFEDALAAHPESSDLLSLKNTWLRNTGR